MKLVSCNTMREGVIVSFSFLIVGVVLLFSAIKLLPNVAYLPMIANVLGVISLLMAPVVLVSTLIATLWPGAKKKMDGCEH